MNFSDTFKKAGLSLVYSYLEKDPENNIPKIIDWVERADDTGQMSRQMEAVKKALKDPDNNWRKWINSLYTDIDPEVRKVTFTNLVVHSNVLSAKKRKDLSEKHDCNIPWAVLIDPTSACNLHCTGCWASEYGDKLNMSFDELDDIIDQGKALGIYMYIYTGGEPLVRKEDIIALCNKHSDCQFLAFTNGTLIDHAFADEMLRVKNFIPALSVEGFRSETDFRRGAGTYDQVEKAMEILKRKKLPFGISCCYTSANAERIGSEAYFDQMIEWGAKFCWFFTYMPVGVDAAPELIATAEQRKYLYDQVRKFRQSKPLFTIDFWNDGEYVHGCIAGGRNYCHINANADLEPCAFIHYSDTNLREKTLLEGFQGPLFMAYRKNQPFNENMLQPCPLLDNPGILASMVDESGAHSTEAMSPEDVHELSAKCVNAAERWATKAESLWSFEQGKSVGYPGCLSPYHGKK